VLRRLGPEDELRPGIWVENIIAKVPHACVIISAYITAIGRRTLFDYMIKSNEFHYCDTDGFSTVDKYKTGTELGELKLEKRIINGHFVAPKIYQLEAEVLKKGKWDKKTISKAKGFSLGGPKESERRFAKLVAGQEVEVDRMFRIRENLRRRGIAPYEETVVKVLRERTIPKRYTFKDGTTRPWTINELKKKLDKS